VSQVTPEELSAFLDGELSESRAIEVQKAVQSDPALGRELEMLRRVDGRIRKATSEPQTLHVTLPPADISAHGTPSTLSVVATVTMLLLARFVPKLTDLTVVALTVEILVFAVVLIMVARLLAEPSPARSLLSAPRIRLQSK